MKQISKKLISNFIKAKRAYVACERDDQDKKQQLLDKSTNAWNKLFLTCDLGFWETELIEALACINGRKETLDVIYKTIAMFGIEVVDE